MFGGREPHPTGHRREQPPEFPDGATFPQGEMPTMPEGEQPPQGDIPTMPEGEQPPQGGQQFPGGFGGQRPGDMGQMPTGEASHLFYMQDKVNFFSGLTAYTPAE